MDEDSRPHVTPSSDMFGKNLRRLVTWRGKKCSLAANLKWAPTGSPEKPVWLYSSCSKPARESRSQCSVLTDLAKNKKYRNVSPETKSNSGKKERQQSERQPWWSTNSANYTGLDSFITQLTDCGLIASICSPLGRSEIMSFHSSQSLCFYSFS